MTLACGVCSARSGHSCITLNTPMCVDNSVLVFVHAAVAEIARGALQESMLFNRLFCAGGGWSRMCSCWMLVNNMVYDYTAGYCKHMCMVSEVG